jgi:hypothetical protein
MTSRCGLRLEVDSFIASGVVVSQPTRLIVQ